MEIKDKRLLRLLGLSALLLLTGCGQKEKPVQETEAEVESVADTEEVDDIKVKDIAYMFKTKRGQLVTVVDPVDYKATYVVPTKSLDVVCDKIPISMLVGDYIVDIGYASDKAKKQLETNLYNLLYGEVVKKLRSNTDTQFSDKSLSKLNNAAIAFPDEELKPPKQFKGADILDKAETVWTACPVDYTLWTNASVFRLPIVTAYVQMKSGEYLVARCYASTKSEYWTLDSMPNYIKLSNDETSELYDFGKYRDKIKLSNDGYRGALSTLKQVIPDIRVEDASKDYVVLDVKHSSQDIPALSVDTSLYDRFAFVRLTDNSIWIVYEKNGMRAVQCLAGDTKHELTTDWDETNVETTDKEDGHTYKFAWRFNDGT